MWFDGLRWGTCMYMVQQTPNPRPGPQHSGRVLCLLVVLLGCCSPFFLRPIWLVQHLQRMWVVGTAPPDRLGPSQAQAHRRWEAAHGPACRGGAALATRHTQQHWEEAGGVFLCCRLPLRACVGEPWPQGALAFGAGVHWSFLACRPPRAADRRLRLFPSRSSAPPHSGCPPVACFAAQAGCRRPLGRPQPLLSPLRRRRALCPSCALSLPFCCCRHLAPCCPLRGAACFPCACPCAFCLSRSLRSSTPPRASSSAATPSAVRAVHVRRRCTTRALRTVTTPNTDDRSGGDVQRDGSRRHHV